MHDINTVELPCLALQPILQAVPLLQEKLKEAQKLNAWVLVTSQDAARVVANAWNAAGKPNARLASVGAATTKALAADELGCEFVPSKALGQVLAN